MTAGSPPAEAPPESPLERGALRGEELDAEAGSDSGVRPRPGARPDVRLRQVRDGDIPAIHTIYSHHVLTGTGSFEEAPPEPSELRRRLGAVSDLGLPAIVAEAGGHVRGYAYAGPFRARSAYRYTVEDSVYVAPEALGLGIGGLLLDGILAACRAAGYRQIVAVIGDSANARSIALHRGRGFHHAGTLREIGWKFARSLDVVFMQRPLQTEGLPPPP